MRLRVHKEMDWKVPTGFCSRACIEMLLRAVLGMEGKGESRDSDTSFKSLVLRGEEI